MSIARCRTVVGSLYALMRNALGLNVATPLESQELSCTVSPDRRLVVLGHEPIAGFARDYGTVADEAAMLALHTLDSATLLAEPTFVAPGDSCLRADDPGWRWNCISGHGQALSDWERRPLAGALTGLAVSGHTHSMADVSGLAGALEARQPASDSLSALARVTPTASGLTLLSIPVPSEPRLARHNPDDTITMIPVPSGGSGGSTYSDDQLVEAWACAVIGCGGTLSASSVSLAEDLALALRDTGSLLRIVALWPFLGTNIAAQSIPLINAYGRIPQVVGWSPSTAADESVGLVCDGAGALNSRITPHDLGVSDNGGLGWYERTVVTGTQQPIGCSAATGDYRYQLDIRATDEIGRWGNPTYSPATGVAAAAAHYYVQRASATSRILYRGGVAIATNSTSQAATNSDTNPLWVGGKMAPTPVYHTGVGAVAYMTDGTLTSTEISALHTALAAFVVATGR